MGCLGVYFNYSETIILNKDGFIRDREKGNL